MKLAARSVLALGLLFGSYLLVVGVVAGLALGLRAAVGAGGGGYGAFRLLVVVVLLAVAAGWTLVTATLRRPDPVPEVRLTRQQHPDLWALVDRVAGELRTRAPDELVLVEQATASVTEQARLLRPSHRVMALGAPLVVAMGSDHLTAVIAHELGHYSGRHAALDRLTYRGQELLVRMIWRLGPRSLLGRALTVCTGGYVAVASAVSRSYEFEADDYAAELVGPATTAEAVEEVPLVAAAWHHYRRADVLRAEESGRRPARMIQVFGELWATGDRRARAVADHLRWAPQASLYDTHPPTEERVARLRARADTSPRVPQDDAPAVSLVGSAEKTLAELEELIYQHRSLVLTPWDELVAEHGRDRARHAAQHLGWLAESQGLTRRADLAALLEIVEDGRGTDLVAPHGHGRDPEGVRRIQLVDLLTRTVEDALVERQGCRHVSGRDGDSVLLGSDGEPLPVRELVQAAVSDPSAVEPLRRWSGERGLLRVHRAARR